MAAERGKSGVSVRLDRADWTEAALDQLATGGVDGVRVELLAKRLGVTKGSFYWHFKDRDALLQEMLNHWRRKATLALIERLDRTEISPEIRLRKLLRLPLVGQRSARAADVELAVRLWGRRDERAQTALTEVDTQRLMYIAGLLIDCGIAADEAESRAVLAYSYMRVAATLLPADAVSRMEQCEDHLLSASLRPKSSGRRPRASLPR